MNAPRSRSPLALLSLLALTVAAAGFRCPGEDPEAMGVKPLTSDGGGGSDVGGQGAGGTVDSGTGGTIAPGPSLCQAYCELEEQCATQRGTFDAAACEKECETLTKGCSAPRASTIREECLDPFREPGGPALACGDPTPFYCIDQYECVRDIEGRCSALCDALQPSNLPGEECPEPATSFDHVQCVGECTGALGTCQPYALVDLDDCASVTPSCDVAFCMVEKESQCIFTDTSPEGPLDWGYGETSAAN